jgi:prepilin-type N-terminal cleavage/methylation domain-containing protein
MKSLPSRTAFTLIELLTTIAIIAVLTAIISPMVSRAMASAQRAKASSNLRQICLAYISYSQENGLLRSIYAETPHEWAAQLARHTGLNEASLYFIENDPAIEGITLPASILADINDTASFDVTGFSKAPIAYALVSGLYTQAPPSTTPIAWTRGLRTDGTWSKDSPYLGRGGFIGFLDGHVAWYTTLSDPNNPKGGLLIEYGTQKPTADIAEAIGAKAGKPNPPRVLEHPSDKG